ncbi:segregation/condensation protein A [Oscillatoria laete-virens NRMC-F 0139]|nr:segregation/condensation protein A [Oscillatoria laete-virens]MDL5055227.1 segregation/condensation protein A [Oscillatoria laete-virens NRMC-F 0139]
MTEELKVKLPVFEGPLDLLLYLIKRDELNIYDIPIEHITRQYLEYLQLMQMLDLEIAGEFLVMAATLMYIKSKTLLPEDQQVIMEEQEEEDVDPRWDLIKRLVEYKKFKDVALELMNREYLQENIFVRAPEKPDFDESATSRPLADVGIFDLLNAFNKVLKKLNLDDDLREIYDERFTVSDKIDLILETIRTQKTVRFTQLFENARSRSEIVVTFLALLELIRLKQITAAQSDHFGEIEISKNEL